jgi:hypothetical protein
MPAPLLSVIREPLTAMVLELRTCTPGAVLAVTVRPSKVTRVAASTQMPWLVAPVTLKPLKRGR